PPLSFIERLNAYRVIGNDFIFIPCKSRRNILFVFDVNPFCMSRRCIRKCYFLSESSTRKPCDSAVIRDNNSVNIMCRSIRVSKHTRTTFVLLGAMRGFVPFVILSGKRCEGLKSQQAIKNRQCVTSREFAMSLFAEHFN